MSPKNSYAPNKPKRPKGMRPVSEWKLGTRGDKKDFYITNKTKKHLYI